jgi:endonuclease IV
LFGPVDGVDVEVLPSSRFTAGAELIAVRNMLGIHASVAGFKSIGESAAFCMQYLGEEAVQIFTYGPKTNSTNRNIGLEEIPGHVYYHSSYALRPWSSSRDTFFDIGRQYLAADKGDTARRAAPLVLHLDHHTVKDMAPVLRKLTKLAAKVGQPFLLEHTAMRPSPTTLDSSERIARFISDVGELDPAGWLRFVPDTSHIFAMQQLIRTYDDAKSWLSVIDPSRVGLLHLNGNSEGVGNYLDRHTMMGGENDNIWRDIEPARSGAAYFIEWCRKHGIDMIHEGHDSDQKKTLSDLKAFVSKL